MSHSALALALAALLIEASCGYPNRLYGWIGHPVTWMGQWLDLLEQKLNRPERPFAWRQGAGCFALLLLLGGTAAVTFPVDLIRGNAFGFIVVAVLAASLPAQRSLHQHVAAVADALDAGLEAGRKAVSQIVGRDPTHLDEAGVARAAIESLAENYSDGVVAPVLWTAVGGLTGGALYKAVNTADSMIGHRSERFAAFGWAAARLDDLVNLPASRLAALLLLVASVMTGADTGAAFATIRRDAGRHRSPNAGWPEAAMAGALGLRLAGPRVYGGVRVDDPYMGDGRADLTAADVRQALRLYRTACVTQAVLLGGLAVAFHG